MEKCTVVHKDLEDIGMSEEEWYTEERAPGQAGE